MEYITLLVMALLSVMIPAWVFIIGSTLRLGPFISFLWDNKFQKIIGVAITLTDRSYLAPRGRKAAVLGSISEGPGN